MVSKGIFSVMKMSDYSRVAKHTTTEAACLCGVDSQPGDYRWTF